MRSTVALVVEVVVGVEVGVDVDVDGHAANSQLGGILPT